MKKYIFGLIFVTGIIGGIDMEYIYLFGIALLFYLFCLIDAEFYGYAKYPERSFNPFYRFPGGGFIAYFKYGKDK